MHVSPKLMILYLISFERSSQKIKKTFQSLIFVVGRIITLKVSCLVTVQYGRMN